MALFKSDPAGFLVGDLIKVNDDILTAQQDGVRVLNSIRSQVGEIARAVGAQTKAQARSTRTGAGGQRVTPLAAAVVPAGRSASGSRTAGGNQTTGPQRVSAAQVGGARRASLSVAVPTQRDGRGRFVAGQRADGSPAAPKGEATGGGGAMTRLSDSIGRLSQSLTATDNIDPAVNAMKEVTDVVTPLGRGLFSMFSRSEDRKKERWYQRIWKALTSPAVGKRTEVAGSGRSGGGIFGALGGIGAMLGGVPAMLMGLLTRIFLPIAAVWGSWELGKWIGGKIYSWLEDSGVLAKVFDAFDAIKESFSGAWESVKSGYETVVSGIEGAWKTITDGFKSALDSFMQFPAKIGEFFSGLDEAMRKIPVIGKVYGSAVDAAKSTLTDAKKGYDEGKSGTSNGAPTSAAQALGRDAGKTVGAVKAVGAQAGAGYDEARGKVSDAPAPTNVVQRAARAAGGAVGSTANAGALAREALAQGITEPKKLALFMGQMHHESGGFRSMSENLNYSAAGLLKNFKGRNGIDTIADAQRVVAGGKDAIAEAIYGGAWGVKKLGNTEAGDGARFKGRGFTQLTGRSNYTAASKALGIDLVKNPELAEDPAIATKIATWYWKTRVASKGADGSLEASTRAINGGSKGIDDRRAQTAKFEAQIAAGSFSGGSMMTATASLPAPKAISIPPSVPAQLPEQAKNEVPERLNSGGAAGGKISVSIKDKTGQNVGDRSIAHIVSGGLGGA